MWEFVRFCGIAENVNALLACNSSRYRLTSSMRHPASPAKQPKSRIISSRYLMAEKSDEVRKMTNRESPSQKILQNDHYADKAPA